ncbi:glycerophosphodiester phosphodiesterase [Mesobacillus zeae]|nr:glycerophosphodiester phosphodiesterase family protein [Mesobacillus zeae]
MVTFFKRNDTNDRIEYMPTTSNGLPEDLTGATAKFVMTSGDKTYINADADIIGDSLVYVFNAADSLYVGNYVGEFHVTLADGTIRHYPRKGFLSIVIERTLDPMSETQAEEAIALNVSLIEDFKADINTQVATMRMAATDAQAATITANAAASHAQTQGDYAKSEADRLVGTDVSVLDNKIGALSNLQTINKDSVVAAVNETTAQLAEKATKDEVSNISLNIDGVNKKLSGIKFSDLQEPIYFAHRGAKNIFPESSQEAYRGCVNMGLSVIEMDVRQATDGTLIVHHDDTMERTTNKTGSIDYYSAMGFKSAVIDLLPGWAGTPVLFEDLLREFGNKVVYAPEIKGAGINTKLVDTMIKYNLQDNVIIQSFSAPDLTYAISKKIPVIYLKASDDVTPATILGWGIKHVGLSTTLPDSYVTSCINAGLKVYMYTVNRRYEHTKYLNMGVHGFFSDDPLWVKGASPVLEWDSFRDQVFSHGMFQPPVDGNGVLGGNRGEFVSPNKFGWTDGGTLRDFCMQGWAGELSSAFTLSAKMNLVSSVSSVRWGSIVFCTPNDYFDDQNTSGNTSSGYNLLIRESGSIELFLRNGSTATQLGTSLATTAIAAGQQVSIKIQATATQIIITRTDTGHTMTINDTTFRKGYLHLGRNYSGVTFENINIVRQGG